jgi:hypothetical protein
MMKELQLLLMVFGVLALGIILYKSVLKPEMIRSDCQRQYSSQIAVNICVEAHKINIHIK